MSEMLSKSGIFSPVVYNNHRRSLGLRGNSSSVKSIFPIRNRCKIAIPSGSFKSGFYGLRVLVDESGRWGMSSFKRSPISPSAQLQAGIIGRSHKWWEKGIQPNMREIASAQDLVDSLLNAGNTLVVVDFFSPGCGGCKALHPKLCQLAGLNPDVQFLQVNYEEHKSMCYSLGVHVLPFFRFYKGAQGRVSNFSCTNATIKKFKDALVKHRTPRCSIGPSKGLEEKELLALAANKDLSFTYTPKPVEAELPPPEVVVASAAAEYEAETVSSSNDNTKLTLSPAAAMELLEGSGEKSLLVAGR